MYKRNYHINEFHNFDILEALFRSKFVHNSKFAALNIDSNIGKGDIKCVKHNNGIVTFNLDLTSYHDIEIPINSTKYDMVQFLYLLEGDIDYKLEHKTQPEAINEARTVIIVNKIKTNSKLRLKNNIRTKFNIISLRRKVYTKIFSDSDDEFSIKALKFINDLNHKKESILIGRNDLKIAEYVKNYFYHIKKENDICFLSAEGSVYHMLSNHFQLALSDDREDNVHELNYTELKKISDLGDYIKAYPEIQYSINLLSSKSALSPAKLQRGFKSLYNRTVSDFVRHIRLQKAEYLMSSTDLNISEIVYSIGFTSRSYFCKIFKNEYGCNPKMYKKSVKKIYRSIDKP